MAGAGARSAAAAHPAASRAGPAWWRYAAALRAIAPLCLLHAGVSAGCGPCQTAGPTSPAAQPAWLAALKKERDSVLASINYTGGVFANPSLGWTQGAYIQPQARKRVEMPAALASGSAPLPSLPQPRPSAPRLILGSAPSRF